MKYMYLLLMLVFFSGCYKNTCYTCTVKTVSADKSINTTKVYAEQYCGKSPREIDKIESEGTYNTTMQSPLTGQDVQVSVSKACAKSGK